MKKIITMAFLALSGAAVLQAQTEQIVPVSPFGTDYEVDFNVILESEDWDEPSFEPSEFFEKTPLDITKLKNGRALDEINIANAVDAYPWISTNGLRVYFTQNVEGTDRIVMAERSSANEPFQKPVALDLNMNEYGNMSCWLSNDELTIYFTVIEAGYQLYKATRQDIKSEFGIPQLIDLGFEDLGFISAPSLTADEEQLFLYQSDGSTRIIQFQRNGENSYEQIATLDFPSDVKNITPGQLSKDGLSYYGLAHSTSNIILMQRDRLDAPFKFENLVEVGNNFHQISVGQDWMVLCHSPNNSWGTNDLYIAASPFKNSIAVNTLTESPVAVERAVLAPINIEIFPNPGETFVNIRFELAELKGEALLEIFDASGKVLKSENILGNGTQTVQVDVSDMPSGAYFCRLIGNGFEAPVKTLIVK